MPDTFPKEAEQFERIMDSIKAVRNMRAEANVTPNKMCHIQIAVLRDDLKGCIENHKEYYEKLTLQVAPVAMGRQ